MAALCLGALMLTWIGNDIAAAELPRPHPQSGREQDADPHAVRAGMLVKIAPYLHAHATARGDGPPTPRPAGDDEPPARDDKRDRKQPAREGEHRGSEPPARPPARPYRIALVGTDRTTKAALEKLGDARIHKRKVVFVKVSPEAAIEHGLGDFDMAYLAGSLSDAQVQAVVTDNRSHPPVTVCERAGFAANGGGIQLFVLKKKMRFEVNTKALARQGIKAEPRLLQLAKRGPRR